MVIATECRLGRDGQIVIIDLASEEPIWFNSRHAKDAKSTPGEPTELKPYSGHHGSKKWSFTKAIKHIPQGYLTERNIINMDFVP